MASSCVGFLSPIRRLEGGPVSTSIPLEQPAASEDQLTPFRFDPRIYRPSLRACFRTAFTAPASTPVDAFRLRLPLLARLFVDFFAFLAIPHLPTT